MGKFALQERGQYRPLEKAQRSRFENSESSLEIIIINPSNN